MSQRKYLTDHLKETDMLGHKPSDSPMDPKVRSDQNLGDALTDHSWCHKLIGKLIYMAVTEPYITFVIGVLSRHMQIPCQIH